MSKEFFELSEFKSRQQRVLSEMDRRGLDLLIVISPININYLVGAAAKAYQVFQCLFVTKASGPETLLLRLSDVGEVTDLSIAPDVRGWGGRRAEDPIAVFAQIIKEKGWLRGRIGLEMPSYYLSVANYLRIQQELSAATVVDATNLIEDLKLVKSKAELEYVRKAAHIADIGIQSIADAIAEGRTERQVAAEAHGAMMAAGGESPPSPMNFVSGERTCYAHGLPTDRTLLKGDFMHVEFGGQYRRYCSTIARHFSIGRPSRLAEEIHAVTNAACEAAIASIKEGVRIHQPHLAAGEVIRKAGFGDYFLHTTGYGIAPGFPPAWGETINMLDDNDRVFEAGMVVSIEPPIFIYPERVGARLIDCVVVKKDSAEVLSSLNRDLIVIER